MLPRLPRILFVLGKGGVGRSTVSAALAMALRRRGARTLVFEWTLSEAIAPWYGLAAAGIDPIEVEPGLAVANFCLEDSLRAYFVGHLGLGAFYRHVVNGRSMRRLVEAAPGIAEMMFLGHLCWLTTLAEKEVGLAFDRIVVDAPATGHGVSLLELPATLASMHASGLLGKEVGRVLEMMGDRRWTGALVVTTPEELATEETLELVPRATRSLGRPLVAALVNRSARSVLSDDAPPAWLDACGAALSPPARAGLAIVRAELRSRLGFERELRTKLAGATERGVIALDEQLGLAPEVSSRAVASALAIALAPFCAEDE
jgi:anion-transporting  ArsA/GET3 family ATPase